MYKLKYQKKKIQSDQKIREREKESKAHLTRNTIRCSPHQRGMGHVRPGWKKPWQCVAQVTRNPGPGHVRPGWHAPGWKKPKQRATQAARCLGFFVLRSSGFFFLFFSSLGFLWYVMGSIFIRVVNRVLETRYPCGRHVEKYATLDYIRP